MSKTEYIPKKKSNTSVSKLDSSFLASKMLKWNLELSGYGLDWTGWDTVK
jgi:hypothetical protein